MLSSALLTRGLELRLQLLLLPRRLELAFFASSFQRRELRLELEVGIMQLRVGEGGLCLEGAVVVPAEEDEQGRDDEDEASGGAHRATVLRGVGNLSKFRTMWEGTGRQPGEIAKAHHDIR